MLIAVVSPSNNIILPIRQRDLIGGPDYAPIVLTRRTRRRNPGRNIFQQVLSEDYWEGYYVLRNGNLIKFQDASDSNADYTVYNMRNGTVAEAGRYAYGEGTTFAEMDAEISGKIGSGIYLRISNQAENPDRHEEIDSILGSSPDTFSLLRVQNLVKHIRNRGISVFGGAIGGQELSQGGYEGFYLFEDGCILYCRDVPNWDDDAVDCIVDGVAEYAVYDPAQFSRDAVPAKMFGYLEGEKFSELAVSLEPEHGRITACLAHAGSEVFGYLMGALSGDAEAAALANHRLRLNLCIRSPEKD